MKRIEKIFPNKYNPKKSRIFGFTGDSIFVDINNIMATGSIKNWEKPENIIRVEIDKQECIYNCVRYIATHDDNVLRDLCSKISDSEVVLKQDIDYLRDYFQ